jgi:DNA (cytosine-5)-methyltransferase 1
LAHSLRAQPNDPHDYTKGTYVPQLARCVATREGQSQDFETTTMVAIAFGGNRTSGPIDVATAVNAHGGPHGRLDFESETFVVGVTDRTSHALKAEGADASEDGTGRGTPIVCQSIALRGREDGGTAELGDDVAFALRASGGGGDKPHVLAIAFNCDAQADQLPTAGRDTSVNDGLTSAVRRLTPRECERLQGFQWQCSPSHPGAWQDASLRWWSADYTAIPWRGKPTADCPDGPRYKSLGNSWAVPKFRWLGQRIARLMPLPY